MPRFHAPVPVVVAALLLGAGPPLAQSQEQESQTAREARREALLDRARQETAQQEERRAISEEVAEGRTGRRSVSDVRNLGPTISLEFPGGSLEHYVALLKNAAAPEPTNILIRGEADAIRINPTELRDVSLFTALRLVSGQYLGGPDGASSYHVSAANLGDEAAGSAFLVDVQFVSGRARPAAAARDVLVLSIKEMTTALPGDPPEVVVPAETILTAIETAISVAGDENVTSEIKFHPESGLIILAGTGNALGAADRVVQQIWSDLEERRGRAREIQKSQGLGNPDALEEQLADARAEAEMAEVRLNLARASAERAALQNREFEQMASQGSGASASEVRDSRQMVLQAEAEMQEQRIRADRARQRVQQAEQALERARAIAAGGGPDSEAQALREENAMLRDRLAMMEAQIAELRARLEGRQRENERR